MEKKREILYFGDKGKPRIREVEGGESRIIEGYAVVFGVQSKILSEFGEIYREIIEPGAITQDDLNRFDIKMTIWHNRERLIARSNMGKGTLNLFVDDIGVGFWLEAPHTPDGNTALELTAREDLSGASFTFWADEKKSVRYTREPNGMIIRHVSKVDIIFEMTLASDPAYVQTSVTVREMEDAVCEEPKHDEEDRECEEKREREISEIKNFINSRKY